MKFNFDESSISKMAPLDDRDIILSLSESGLFSSLSSDRIFDLFQQSDISRNLIDHIKKGAFELLKITHAKNEEERIGKIIGKAFSSSDLEKEQYWDLQSQYEKITNYLDNKNSLLFTIPGSYINEISHDVHTILTTSSKEIITDEDAESRNDIFKRILLNSKNDLSLTNEEEEEMEMMFDGLNGSRYSINFRNNLIYKKSFPNVDIHKIKDIIKEVCEVPPNLDIG